MLFHTWPFLFLFAVVFCGLWPLRSTRWWVPWLLVASYFFYGWWNPYYLILIFYSTLLDFVVVAIMDRCPRHGRGVFSRRFWLLMSIVNNLALLGFFKYADFFIDNINHLLPALGQSWQVLPADQWLPRGWQYLLPVGISFYTFQSMSYTIDFYRGQIERERSFLRFATFVSFFPQLVAGPIERAANLLPQFHQPPQFRWRNLTDGMSLFLVGLFKKVALANYLALYVERIYGQPAEYDASSLAMATFCFAWQIYFDFSGYTDMARGIAQAMGFRLMMNFNNPYLATGLGDFWARWHISLSTWFRDYVYIPLGGNQYGEPRTYRNLFLVFVISGFWHGANWTFIVWGALHALGAMTTRTLERSSWYRQQVPRFVKQVAVFVFVCFTWIFFRAESMSDALLIVRRIASQSWLDPACPLMLLILVGSVWVYQFIHQSRVRRILDWPMVKIALAVAMIVYLCLCSTAGGQFIYFQF
jgi:D-alanyl-lipoteichoic acid acyltransferase DltB (MBOAT superfamily)